eukprot:CAMPEP_0117543802 /NCGR_PEP_ID=MMETSP0784-20121206/45247_1 /TAXON_ID=39447 /ORGANISM="" /LENGTH=115 /DNA_ID=CAMNT_0005340589 /DNA_START=202 /DNA_END=546 /DNA_ORIENTATION=+
MQDAASAKKPALKSAKKGIFGRAWFVRALASSYEVMYMAPAGKEPSAATEKPSYSTAGCFLASSKILVRGGVVEEALTCTCSFALIVSTGCVMIFPKQMLQLEANTVFQMDGAGS